MKTTIRRLFSLLLSAVLVCALAGAAADELAGTVFDEPHDEVDAPVIGEDGKIHQEPLSAGLAHFMDPVAVVDQEDILIEYCGYKANSEETRLFFRLTYRKPVEYDGYVVEEVNGFRINGQSNPVWTAFTSVDNMFYAIVINNENAGVSRPSEFREITVGSIRAVCLKETENEGEFVENEEAGPLYQTGSFTIVFSEVDQ